MPRRFVRSLNDIPVSFVIDDADITAVHADNISDITRIGSRCAARTQGQ